ARRHAFEKNLLRPLVGIELRIVLGAERALRLAGYQGAAEPVPILVMTLVEMSQQPANIGGLTANEVAIAFGRVGVAALAVPVEQPQGPPAHRRSRGHRADERRTAPSASRGRAVLRRECRTRRARRRRTALWIAETNSRC